MSFAAERRVGVDLVIQHVSIAAGGLGLFLLGMVILSQGLRELAGATLQRALRRFTRSPASGAATGTVTTALVQSSSVTTVTAVGFASAGLLSFPEALGIVFGANIGTTLTGWIVALVGFKLQLATVMPVLVLAGALLRIFGSGRTASFGLAVAGFGLVFFGIEMLRDGTSAFEGAITPEHFSDGALLGRLQLIGVGVAFTLVTQSSSAGVASALAAVEASVLDFGQAAALVIGMDVGTTVTAAIAATGAPLAGRRTGWAHVIYNVMTAILALCLLPLFRIAADWISPGVLVREPEVSLVAFHSFFNLAGVVAVLPVAVPFARLIERLIPERSTSFADQLDRRLISQPDVALRALSPILENMVEKALGILRDQLDPASDAAQDEEQRELLQIASGEVEQYLSSVPASPESIPRRKAILHVLDQLKRLLGREAQHDRVRTLLTSPRLSQLKTSLEDLLTVEGGPEEARLARLCDELRRGRSPYRDEISAHVEPEERDTKQALRLMDAYRWLERVVHHAWRITHHLDQLRREKPTGLVVEPTEPD